MNKTLLLIGVMVMAGCAAPRPITNSSGRQPSEREILECDYEATKASAAVRNGMEAGYVQGTVRRQCLALKGYK